MACSLPALSPASCAMKRPPLTPLPIALDARRSIDDPKLSASPSLHSFSRSHSDDELRHRPSLYQRRKSAAPGLSLARPAYHRRRSHNRRPSPARNSPATPVSLTPAFNAQRRISLPALHFREKIQDATHPAAPQRRDSISQDMYGALQSFTFGAPPSHTSHQSLEDDEDEDERQRRDRAKMRAIDDGTRRPSLPTNSSTPTAPRSKPSLSSLSSAGIVVGERQWDDHSELDWDTVMGDITPTKATSPPPSSSESGSTRSEPGGSSAPISIPMIRRRSRSADELTMDLEQRATPRQTTFSTPAPRFAWVDRRSSGEEGVRHPSLSEPVYTGPEMEVEQLMSKGFDLNYILSSQKPDSADLEDPQAKQQAIIGLFRSKLRNKPKNPVYSRLEDTFVRHIMDSDPIHKQRQSEWTFRQEARLRHSTSSTKGKDRERIATHAEDYECWRCEWVGRFNVTKDRQDNRSTVSPSVDPSKKRYARLRIVHSLDPDNKGNNLGGPSVLVHRHSRAQAFSIFRVHDIYSQKALDSADAVMLGVKSVLLEYTRTESTRALRTHGLTDEGQSRPQQMRSVTGLPERPRHHNQGNVLISAPQKPRQPTASTSNVQRISISPKPTTPPPPEARTHNVSTASTSSSRPNTASSITTLRPPVESSSHAPNSSRVSTSLDPGSPISQWEPSSTKSPRLSTSHAEAFAMVDADARDLSSYHHRNDSGPLSLLSSARSIPSHAVHVVPAPNRSPPQTQRTFGIARIIRAFGSKQQQQGKDPGSPVDEKQDELRLPIPDGKPAAVVPWMTTANRSEKEQHKRAIRNLNDSFESVGLIPPPDKKKDHKPRAEKSHKGSKSVLDDVPDDSMCMLLPLWLDRVGVSAQSRPHELSRSSSRSYISSKQSFIYHSGTAVPLDERRFLLVYYADLPELASDDEGGNNKKRRRPQTAGEPSQHPALARAPARSGSFYAVGRLLTYNDLRNTGVRLPDKGLYTNSILSDNAIASPLPPNAWDSDGFEVIAICLGKEDGVALVHDGLVKLGLVATQANEEDVRLSEVGRTIIEMVWCGCISLISFTP
ncbi:hypothetical protein K439DRAFT_1398589 [Ramaria rubella]|nr:hypothetical protein K439DRAFT_1398589 [Ramaria rubella]